MGVCDTWYVKSKQHINPCTGFIQTLAEQYKRRNSITAVSCRLPLATLTLYKQLKPNRYNTSQIIIIPCKSVPLGLGD